MSDDIKLSEEEKEQLLKFLEDYANKISQEDIYEIKRKLNKKILQVRGKRIPHYVAKMLSQIKDLILVFNSSEVPDYKRKHVIAALHYFMWAEDRTPDYIPIIGYLDDAFIIAIVHHRVSQDINRLKK